jgi:hypothetical protein
MRNIETWMRVRFGRNVLCGAIVAVALGLLAVHNVTAAPANGPVINQTAMATSPVTKVPCAVRRVCGYRGCVARRACW